jgi:hypothetical protein
MDHAVALVQAYLQANGYFTVAEYPVLSTLPDGGYQSATDVDLLALRLCEAGGVVAAGRTDDSRPAFEPDPVLHIPRGTADLLLIEVKEGRAELNRGAKDPQVLEAVLSRFGLRRHAALERSLDELERKGHTRWPGEVWVRMFAFGSTVDPAIVHGFRAISLTHVTRYLNEYIRGNWDVLRHAHIRHEAFGFLALMEQVRRAALEEERA